MLQQETSVAVVSDSNVTVARARQTTVIVGHPRATGILAFVRNTYPAVYNHVGRNMNYLYRNAGLKESKRMMRGGHFLLYRYVILVAFLLSLGFGIASIYVKACSTVPFVISVIYIAISIANIVIFCLNRPAIDPARCREVPAHVIMSGLKNDFYTVPLRTTFAEVDVIAMAANPVSFAAALKRENTEYEEVEVMLYNHTYRRDSKFPKECILHLLLFLVMFILGIIFVTTTVSYPTTSTSSS